MHNQNQPRILLASLTVAAILLPACGSRNLYRNVELKNPPLRQGFVYMTRNRPPDAGQDPVEFGSPLASKDRVYVQSETVGLEAFDRYSFQRRWTLKIKNGTSSDMALQDGVLFFGANDGQFYAVDSESGRTLWKYETKAPVFARPTIVGSRVFISASDDIVYCLDRSSGKWIWHYKRGGSYITTVRGNSSVAVDNGQAYVGFSDGYIVSLNVADGNLIWEQKIHKGSKFTDVDAMPVISGSTIYIPSYDGELYSLEKTKGKILWHIDVGGSKKVLLEDNVLYLAASNGFVYSINKETGRILWKFELDEGTPTNLILRDGYLAFGGSRQFFYAIHKGDGTLAFRRNVGLRSGFFSTPSMFEKEIYALSNFGNLYVFHWLPNRNAKKD
jgi:outer membrane protein assembly factor BamB